MAAMRSRPEGLLRRALRSPLGVRFTRYTAGSAVAAVTSQLVFVLVYGLFALAGPRGATALAFLAGFLPNYYLNRRWTWGRRGRVAVVRELVPYAAVVVAGVGIAAVATSLAEEWVLRLGVSRPVQVTVVTLAFVVAQGVLFVGKFVIFDRVLFADRSGAPARTR